MTALTKSVMAEKLYEELGLNKREAKEVVEHFLKKFDTLWKIMSKSSYQVLVILICEIKAKDRVVIQKLGKRFPFPPVAL